MFSNTPVQAMGFHHRVDLKFLKTFLKILILQILLLSTISNSVLVVAGNAGGFVPYFRPKFDVKNSTTLNGFDIKPFSLIPVEPTGQSYLVKKDNFNSKNSNFNTNPSLKNSDFNPRNLKNSDFNSRNLENSNFNSNPSLKNANFNSRNLKNSDFNTNPSLKSSQSQIAPFVVSIPYGQDGESQGVPSGQVSRRQRYYSDSLESESEQHLYDPLSGEAEDRIFIRHKHRAKHVKFPPRPVVPPVTTIYSKHKIIPGHPGGFIHGHHHHPPRRLRCRRKRGCRRRKRRRRRRKRGKKHKKQHHFHHGHHGLNFGGHFGHSHLSPSYSPAFISYGPVYGPPPHLQPDGHGPKPFAVYYDNGYGQSSQIQPTVIHQPDPSISQIPLNRPRMPKNYRQKPIYYSNIDYDEYTSADSQKQMSYEYYNNNININPNPRPSYTNIAQNHQNPQNHQQFQQFHPFPSGKTSLNSYIYPPTSISTPTPVPGPPYFPSTFEKPSKTDGNFYKNHHQNSLFPLEYHTKPVIQLQSPSPSSSGPPGKKILLKFGSPTSPSLPVASPIITTLPSPSISTTRVAPILLTANSQIQPYHQLYKQNDMNYYANQINNGFSQNQNQNQIFLSKPSKTPKYANLAGPSPTYFPIPVNTGLPVFEIPTSYSTTSSRTPKNYFEDTTKSKFQKDLYNTPYDSKLEISKKPPPFERPPFSKTFSRYGTYSEWRQRGRDKFMKLFKQSYDNAVDQTTDKFNFKHTINGDKSIDLPRPEEQELTNPYQKYLNKYEDTIIKSISQHLAPNSDVNDEVSQELINNFGQTIKYGKRKLRKRPEVDGKNEIYPKIRRKPTRITSFNIHNTNNIDNNNDITNDNTNSIDDSKPYSYMNLYRNHDNLKKYTIDDHDKKVFNDNYDSQTWQKYKYKYPKLLDLTTSSSTEFSHFSPEDSVTSNSNFYKRSSNSNTKSNVGGASEKDSRTDIIRNTINNPIRRRKRIKYTNIKRNGEKVDFISEVSNESVNFGSEKPDLDHEKYPKSRRNSFGSEKPDEDLEKYSNFGSEKPDFDQDKYPKSKRISYDTVNPGYPDLDSADSKINEVFVPLVKRVEDGVIVPLKKTPGGRWEPVKNGQNFGNFGNFGKISSTLSTSTSTSTTITTVRPKFVRKMSVFRLPLKKLSQNN